MLLTMMMDDTTHLLSKSSLPSPDSLMTTSSNDRENAIQQQQQHSLSFGSAAGFIEDVGLGAISRAGALPSGGNGEWIQLVESKMKKENNLDYHSLMWEMGVEVAEQRQQEQEFNGGGLNATQEEQLLNELTTWFNRKGGRLQFVEPVLTKEGYRLNAVEDVHNSDSIISIPFELIMCQQTARNVVIQKYRRYLGEELQKTFDKDEVWGLAIFLLHEYYKEMNGNGSKWGPFIRTLRMRMISTQVLQVTVV